MRENTEQNNSKYGQFLCSERQAFYYLKLVSAIFIIFLFFHQVIALQKLKNVFISSKKPNGSGLIYDVMNWLA